MPTVTTEDLKTLVIQGDATAMCNALASLTEAERMPLAGYAAKLCYWLNRYWSPSTKTDTIPIEEPDRDEILELMKTIKEQTYRDWRCPRWAAQLMAVALCDQRFMESTDASCGWSRTDLQDMPHQILKVLAARRPPWLEKWLEKEWRNEYPIPNWYVERGLIRAGALPSNDSPEYYARMAAVFPFFSYSNLSDAAEYEELSDNTDHASFRSIKELIADDPDLLEHDIWRLFDIDSDAFRYRLKEWGTALVEFSQEGKLDRMRLLKRSLDGMTLPLAPTTLNGFGKFHEMLEPTLEERVLLMDQYLQLLASSNSTVVGNALNALAKLQTANRLDADSYLASMPNAFLIDKKSQPSAALKLAVKLMKQSPECKPKAVKAIIPAIRHSNADIQAEAIAVLESSHKLIDQEDANELASMTENVVVAVRPKLDKLLQSCLEINVAPKSSADKSAEPRAKSKAKPSANSKTELATSDSIPIDSELLRQASALPELLRRQSHLDAALAALNKNAQPMVHPVEKHVAPRRDPSCQIKPVQSLDELIALVSSTIEHISDIIDLERVLDGICRFQNDKPDDFDLRVGALRQRVANRAENHNQEVLYYSINIGFPQLLMAWLGLPTLTRTNTVHWYNMRGWFLRERISSIQNDLIESRNPYARRPDAPMPMLALPTHKGGWLDPVILVERLNNSYAKYRELPRHYDLAQAILRLTPDGRREALGMLGEPDHYNGGVPLRYALGDDCELSNNGGWGIEAVMIAAERARAISLADSHYTPRLPIARAKIDDQQVISVDGALTDDPTVPFSLAEKALSTNPTSISSYDPNLLDHQWVNSWEAMTNPMDTEASCLAGHMAHLFDPEATWASEACRLCLLATSNDRNETRIAATDALIEAIERLLVIPERLGEAMAGCQSHLKLNRTLKAFNEAAQVSPLHHWIVLQSLARYIETSPQLPSDIHLILAQMLESAMTLGAEINPNIRERLSPLGDKSKAAKLAKELSRLRQSETFPSSLNKAIFAKTLERAQRWERILPG